MRADGQRETLITILVQASAGVLDCLSDIVAQDAADPDALWLAEVWESAESHRASLALSAVQHALGLGAAADCQPGRALRDRSGRHQC